MKTATLSTAFIKHSRHCAPPDTSLVLAPPHLCVRPSLHPTDEIPPGNPPTNSTDPGRLLGLGLRRGTKGGYNHDAEVIAPSPRDLFFSLPSPQGQDLFDLLASCLLSLLFCSPAPKHVISCVQAAVGRHDSWLEIPSLSERTKEAVSVETCFFSVEKSHKWNSIALLPRPGLWKKRKEK